MNYRIPEPHEFPWIQIVGVIGVIFLIALLTACGSPTGDAEYAAQTEAVVEPTQTPSAIATPEAQWIECALEPARYTQIRIVSDGLQFMNIAQDFGGNYVYADIYNEASVRVASCWVERSTVNRFSEPPTSQATWDAWASAFAEECVKNGGIMEGTVCHGGYTDTTPTSEPTISCPPDYLSQLTVGYFPLLDVGEKKSPITVSVNCFDVYVDFDGGASLSGTLAEDGLSLTSCAVVADHTYPCDLKIQNLANMNVRGEYHNKNGEDFALCLAVSNHDFNDFCDD